MGGRLTGILTQLAQCRRKRGNYLRCSDIQIEKQVLRRIYDFQSAEFHYDSRSCTNSTWRKVATFWRCAFMSDNRSVPAHSFRTNCVSAIIFASFEGGTATSVTSPQLLGICKWSILPKLMPCSPVQVPLQATSRLAMRCENAFNCTRVNEIRTEKFVSLTLLRHRRSQYYINMLACKIQSSFCCAS